MCDRESFVEREKMQASLLHDTTASNNGSKKRMLASFISMGVGLYIGIVLLSPMHEPASNMMMALFQPSKISPLARNAPGPVGFANPQRFNLRGLPSVNAFDPMIARSGYGASLTRPILVRAESELLQRLDEAIAGARECTSTGSAEECLVAWDAVEELSAAVAHAEPKTSSSEFPKLSEADMKTFKETMAKFAAAREKVPAEVVNRNQIDENTMAEIAKALAAKQSVVSGIGNVRLAKLEEKIQTAKEEAKASKSAVDWDIVEELMQERSHLMKFDGSN